MNRIDTSSASGHGKAHFVGKFGSHGNTLLNVFSDIPRTFQLHAYMYLLMDYNYGLKWTERQLWFGLGKTVLLV